MRENDALSMNFTPSRTVVLGNPLFFQLKTCWQVLCSETVRVETHEVIYEASVPRVHTDRTAGRHRHSRTSRCPAPPRAERREKARFAQQHEICGPEPARRSRPTGLAEGCSDCHAAANARNGQKLRRENLSETGAERRHGGAGIYLHRATHNEISGVQSGQERRMRSAHALATADHFPRRSRSDGKLAAERVG